MHVDPTPCAFCVDVILWVEDVEEGFAVVSDAMEDSDIGRVFNDEGRGRGAGLSCFFIGDVGARATGEDVVFAGG